MYRKKDREGRDCGKIEEEVNTDEGECLYSGYGTHFPLGGG